MARPVNATAHQYDSRDASTRPTEVAAPCRMTVRTATPTTPWGTRRRPAPRVSLPRSSRTAG